MAKEKNKMPKKEKAPEFAIQLENVDKQIKSTTKKLNDLEAERANILAKQTKQELENLNELLKSTGKTPADIKALLEKTETE